MKRIFLSLCLVAAVGLTACHDDPDDPENPGGNNPQEEVIPTGEGIYNPGKHISVMTHNGGMTSDEWLWQDRRLRSINTTDADGNLTDVQTYIYDGWRLSNASLSGGAIPGTASYTYTDNKLSSLNITTSGIHAATAEVVHTGEKITHLDINVDNDFIQLMMSMTGGMGYKNIATSTFGQELCAGMASIAPVAALSGKHGDSKYSVNSTDFDVDLVWDGNNVKRVLLVGQIELGVTVDELSQMSQFLPVDSLFSEYATFLQALAGDRELPVSITLRDSMEYSYDNQTNPLKGFFGQVDAAVLSANNVLSLYSNITASGVLTIPIYGTYSISVPFSLPIGGVSTQTYTYTYDAAGYPSSVEDSEGNLTTYNYQENQSK